jgi:N-dimethylarginine dimethylaminohydrolase
LNCRETSPYSTFVEKLKVAFVVVYDGVFVEGIDEWFDKKPFDSLGIIVYDGVFVEGIDEWFERKTFDVIGVAGIPDCAYAIMIVVADNSIRKIINKI